MDQNFEKGPEVDHENLKTWPGGVKQKKLICRICRGDPHRMIRRLCRLETFGTSFESFCFIEIWGWLTCSYLGPVKAGKYVQRTFFGFQWKIIDPTEIVYKSIKTCSMFELHLFSHRTFRFRRWNDQTGLPHVAILWIWKHLFHILHPSFNTPYDLDWMSSYNPEICETFNCRRMVYY